MSTKHFGVRMYGHVLALLTLSTLACDDGPHLIDPDTQLVVFNEPEAFHVQSSTLEGITQILSYTWQTVEPMADVIHSGALSGGTATLVIRDGSGVEVYRRNLAAMGTTETNQGMPGAWTIEINFDGMSGVLNVRVQAP